MPRYYESEADMLSGIRGYKARAAIFAGQQAAKQAEMNSPEALARVAHLAAIREDARLRDVVAQAEDHLAKLNAKLDASRRQAELMAENAYLSGDIHAGAGKVRRQIEGLPALITRAEGELAAARDALAAHRARVAEASAVDPVPSFPSPEVESVEAEAIEVKRGPGRPKKAAA